MLWKILRVLIVAIALLICVVLQGPLLTLTTTIYNWVINVGGGTLPDWLIGTAAKEYVPVCILCLIRAVIICLLAKPFSERGK